MRGFPLNELLTATDIDKIRELIVSIFANMRKLGTRYKPSPALFHAILNVYWCIYMRA